MEAATQKQENLSPPSFDLSEPYVFEHDDDLTIPRELKYFHLLRRAEESELIQHSIAADSDYADIILYNSIVAETRGYRFNVTPGQSDQKSAQALAIIPPAHKRHVIKAILAVESRVEFDALTEIYEWGAGTTYTVISELGLQGQFAARHRLRSPSESEIYNYRKEAQQVFIDKGGALTSASKLTAATELYDSLILEVENMVISGQPVDVTNPKHLATINGHIKRSVIDALLGAFELDLYVTPHSEAHKQ